MKKLSTISVLLVLCNCLPMASAQTYSLDTALEAYERGHYREALKLARLTGQSGNARALELAATMQWHGARLYGAEVSGDRADAIRLFSAAVALDPERQLKAAPFYLTQAAKGQMTTNAASAAADATLPTNKRTVLGLYMSAAQASEVKRRRGDEVLLIDVRTRAEVQYVGLPEAIDMHIPYMENSVFFEWDDARRQFKVELNHQFAQDIAASVAASPKGKDALIMLICRSGDRSASAVNLLAQLGYSQVYSVVDGFEGDLSPNGRRTVNGWKNAGLPWNYKLDKTRMSQSQ